MSISSLSLLLRDPYGFYAKTILGLRPLDPLNRPADAALRGQIVHRMMEHLCHALNKGESLSMQTYERVAKQVLAAESEPLVRHQWAPRIFAMGEAIISLEQLRRAQGVQVLPEESLEVTLGDVTIQGRADRIEKSESMGAVVDYKTGSPPTEKSVLQGFEPQLPLLAMMLRQKDGSAAGYEELSYWQLSGVQGQVSQKPIKANIDDLLERYHEGLSCLFAYYYGNEHSVYTSMPQPDAAPTWNDYEHLARLEA